MVHAHETRDDQERCFDGYNDVVVRHRWPRTLSAAHRRGADRDRQSGRNTRCADDFRFAGQFESYSNAGHTSDVANASGGRVGQFGTQSAVRWRGLVSRVGDLIAATKPLRLEYVWSNRDHRLVGTTPNHIRERGSYSHRTPD